MRLAQLAEATGGQAFFPAVDEGIDVDLRRIVAEIKAPYLLGYVSTDRRTDGAWRKVEVAAQAAGSATG